LLDGDVTDGEIEIPAAGDGYPAGRMCVSVSEPGPGVGAELLAPRKVESAEEVTGDAQPPLGRPEVSPALIGGLSYSALSAFKNCGYRFYVERVLGIAEPEVVSVDGDETAAPEVRRRFGPGLAVHSLLEWSARNRWREPSAERVAAALREQGLDQDDGIGQVLDLTKAFLDSSLREQVADAQMSPEVPFVLSVGDTLIRGSIDLLARKPDGSVVVVDYKTDRLGGRDPAETVSRYSIQRDLYALAASARGAPVETAYVFLERPDEPVRETFGEAELEAARGRVETVLERLAAGSFEVTDRPHKALCADCPARERLCSHKTDSQMRDEPDPPIEPPPHGDNGEPAETQPGVANDDSQLSLLEGR
jgi:ATP-dependent helicase/nuclease subunit A